MLYYNTVLLFTALCFLHSLDVLIIIVVRLRALLAITYVLAYVEPL
jgi:hypothetical protein